MSFFRKILLFILGLLCVSIIFAQDKRLKRADEIYEAGEYFRAITEYTKILRKEKNKSPHRRNRRLIFILRSADVYKAELCFHSPGTMHHKQSHGQCLLHPPMEYS